MNVLVTGIGYIGSVLVDYLSLHDHHVIGLDAGWFKDCTLGPVINGHEHHTGDIRDVKDDIFNGVDAVIHLAALSNDPLGELDPRLTHSINSLAAINLALDAKTCGVKRFVFASSQSVYGVSEKNEELDEDAFKNSVTAYAQSKLIAEQTIRAFNGDDFCAVALRPATVFGVSPRLRTDIVFNDFLAQAYLTGRIEVRSDGTPWRPVVHVLDLCRAFLLALEAPAEVVGGKAYNVTGMNYNVAALAEVANRLVPGSQIEYADPDPDDVVHGKGRDQRSYRTSSERIEKDMPWLPTVSLEQGGEELLAFFKKVGLTPEMAGNCNRLAVLKRLLAEGKLDRELRCVSKS